MCFYEGVFFESAYVVEEYVLADKQVDGGK
jgi:hypothetical protein